jgi:peptide/nickel transport system ATP-binding protein/oligopeptide transport system ATP-binding protein
LSKRYRLKGNFGRGQRELNAANEVSFEIQPGTTLALVGSSGSGKSTVARCLTRLEKPDTGEIWLGQTDIAQLQSCDLQPVRTKIQMIFQDPVMSMNPRMSALQVIEEPLLIQGWKARERKEKAAKLISDVGLSPDWLNRRITEFSGGQRQRIAIARALMVEPKCLVLDEALSGLDLKTQSQIANLLLELQAACSLTYLLIAHDLTLVARIADCMAVMATGRIVEQGQPQQMLSEPAQPETQRLVASAKRLQAALSLQRGASA